MEGTSAGAENFRLEEKQKGRITNALKYCKTLLQNDDLFTSSPTDEISGASMAMAEEFHGAILEILENLQIIEAEELILNEEDEFNEFTKCPGFLEDGENFVPEEFAPEPRDYIPLWYKKNAVALAGAHPRWSLKSLQDNGAGRLKQKYLLRRSKDDVSRGGTHFDKWKTIDYETYERFVEARKNMEQKSS